jgi:hypothetical protein
MNMDIAVIIELPKSLAGIMNKADKGIVIKDTQGNVAINKESELNPGPNELHGRINNRVFVVRNTKPGQQLNVIEENSGEERKFTVPHDREYVIITF